MAATNYAAQAQAQFVELLDVLTSTFAGAASTVAQSATPDAWSTITTPPGDLAGHTPRPVVADQRRASLPPTTVTP